MRVKRMTNFVNFPFKTHFEDIKLFTIISPAESSYFEHDCEINHTEFSKSNCYNRLVVSFKELS